MRSNSLGLAVPIAALLHVVAAASPGNSQEEPPVFRGEIYVVPVEFSMSTKLPFLGINRPYKDLTLDDVTVVLDKKTYAPVKLSQDPKRPGHYLLSFTPAEEHRDGASHLIEIVLKVKRFRSPLVMQQTITIPRPLREADEQRVEGLHAHITSPECEISVHQRLFPHTGPALDLMLSPEGIA